MKTCRILQIVLQLAKGIAARLSSTTSLDQNDPFGVSSICARGLAFPDPRG
jgi:hypothetical protein